MTKTLTERWRDGDMEGGIYYCKTKSYGEKKLWFHHRVYGGMYVQTYGTEEMFPEEDIIEVLAPVPSFDEHKQLVSKTEQLKKRLEIATKALEEYADSSNWYETDDFGISAVDQFACDDYGYNIAKEALKEIEGVK